MFKKTCVILLLMSFSFMSNADQLRFVTEELPPFHFLDANKKPTGALVDIINALMIRTKLSGRVEFMPFARSFDLALKKQNIFMISLMKSAERQNKFQWVGQIFKSKAFLVGLRSRSDINISNLDEEKSFTVGTIRAITQRYI
jgi:polar amino acid transport system substrate-binding protein